MKNIDPREDDSRLSQLLQSWHVTAPLPPRFQEQVWQRIGRSEAEKGKSPWAEFLDWLDTALPRRAPALAYVGILLLAGLSAGYWQAHLKAEQLDEALGRRYVQMVDPLQANR